MNILILLPVAVLVIPALLAFIEIFKRKDKGPRMIPEQTLYEGSPDASKQIPRLERARAKARLNMAGEMIRIVGDVSTPSGIEINEDIVVHGNLKLGSRSHVHGSVKAFGEVEVGEESVVEGHITSEGRVTIRRNARVNGIVDSAETIILEENAVAEAVSTGKSVRLAPGAKVNRRISAGASIITTHPHVQEPVTKRPHLPIREEASEVEAINENRLKYLTPKEVEIYKLAISGCGVDEIGLRLFMDPAQVQEVIRSLIESGCLDENLKPVTLEKVGEKAEGTTGAAPAVRVRRDESQLEELPIALVFERLLASKLRVEVRKGLKGVEQSTTEVKETDDESATNTKTEEILEEWRRASSILFSREEKGKGNLSYDAMLLEQTREEDLETSDTGKKGSEAKETPSVTRSAHRRYLGLSLPPLILLSILFSELAYYNPGLPIFAFLEDLIPPTITAWMFLLGIALALAAVAILYFAKTLSPSRLKMSRSTGRSTGLYYAQTEFKRND